VSPNAEPYWRAFIDLVVVVWVGLFGLSLASRFGVVALAPATAETVRVGLRWLLAVFLLDVALCYRWSEKGPRAFLRAYWLRVLAVVPWARPFRLLRVGGGAIRGLMHSRRAGGLLNKLRRMGSRLRDGDDD